MWYWSLFNLPYSYFCASLIHQSHNRLLSGRVTAPRTDELTDLLCDLNQYATVQAPHTFPLSVQCIIVCTYTHVCVLARAWGWHWMSFFVILHCVCFFLLNGVSHWTWSTPVQLDWQARNTPGIFLSGLWLLSPYPVCNIGVLGILTQIVMFAHKDSKHFTDQAMTRKLLLVCGLHMWITCFFLIHLFLVNWITRTQAVRVY